MKRSRCVGTRFLRCGVYGGRERFNVVGEVIEVIVVAEENSSETAKTRALTPREQEVLLRSGEHDFALASSALSACALRRALAIPRRAHAMLAHEGPREGRFVRVSDA
jgi:hypothetical protein